jgi:sigma-B regulation protein RsbU (phosphoserine phosphatase)
MRVSEGLLRGEAPEGWTGLLFQELATEPDVASICYGTVDGDAVYLQRNDGRLEFGTATARRGGEQLVYGVDESGRPTPPPTTGPTYDPRERPWYKAAVEAGSAVWTPIYFWFADRGADSVTGTGFTRPITVDGQLAGVLVVDVTLGALSGFLREQPLAKQGSIFLVDEQRLLIASSTGPVNSPTGERLSLSSVVPEVADALSRRARRFESAGAASRIESTVLAPQPGIRWEVITVLPESTFLADVASMRRKSILMAALASLGAMVLGVGLSGRITRPLMALTDHVNRVGAGDFDHRLQLTGARELVELSGELNRMSGGLRQRLELEQSMQVAMQVQQCLLPRRAPEVKGLELFGRSRYCDATGGDYFDFVDVAGLDDERALIAVGDVTGHGIAAALLMATARAAVRAGTLAEGSLGDLMTRVNTVLARDASHGLYMTMTLLVIEPARGTIRFACAAHDPIILYDPQRDEFRELDDGDVPLGAMEGFEYGEYYASGIVPGTVIVVGTDGIWEARSESDEMYGKDRLRELIRANGRKPARAIAEALDESLSEFLGDRSVQDDVTYVIARIVEVEE